MSDKNIKSVSVTEHTLVVESIFKYLRSIDASIALEYLDANAKKSICFKQIGTAKKIKENIIGGYTGELSFDLFVAIDASDTRSILDGVDTLNQYASEFEKETINGFPKLKLPEYHQPMSLEITMTPEDITGKENNKATFVATYKLLYRKK